jgi:C4-dicarboxylate transporter, DctM subunit
MAILVLLLVVLALFGMPLFAVMGGGAALAFISHFHEGAHSLSYLAPNVLDDKFAGSQILVTIPLFTFVGYLMAESNTPDRIVRASQAVFGWLPGGLAIVAIVASSFFTTLTGGSGVTIVAIGGLLYPALRKQGYPDNFSLGLVTTGGSLGLLLPPSLPILIYALIAGIDFNKAFKAGLIPGFMIIVMLSVYSSYIAIKYKVPRSKPNFKEIGSALWLMKWELMVPVIILGGLGTGLTGLDESAALAAGFTFVIEVFVYKDLDLKKDIPRVAKASMSLAGAIILILAMANSLINYVIQVHIPNKVLDAMVSIGLSQSWQFLIALNIFLLVLGMVMDGFSAIIVAVPLILPFASRFHLHPFHLAMMFLLNLEIAYCCPPLGLNLYISSFRFNRPVVSLYRIVMPMLGILTMGLLLIMYIPKISTVLVDRDAVQLRAKAAAANEPPREAWALECVQEDPSTPLPCTDAEKLKFKDGNMPGTTEPDEPDPDEKKSTKKPEKANGEDGDDDDNDDGDDLMEKMRKAAKGESTDDSSKKEDKEDSEDKKKKDSDDDDGGDDGDDLMEKMRKAMKKANEKK